MASNYTYENPTAQAADRTLWGIRQYMHQTIKTKWTDENTGQVLRWAITCEQAGALMDWLKAVHESYGVWTQSQKTGQFYWKLDNKTENGSNGLKIITDYSEQILAVFPDLRPVPRVSASVANSTPAPVVLAPPTFGTASAQTIAPVPQNGDVVIVQAKQRRAPKVKASTVNTNARNAAKMQAEKVKAAKLAQANPTGSIPIGAPVVQPIAAQPTPSYIMIQ